MLAPFESAEGMFPAEIGHVNSADPPVVEDRESAPGKGIVHSGNTL
jgi:hypothetical protein